VETKAIREPSREMSPCTSRRVEADKTPAAKPGETDTWKVTRVGGASHTPDSAAMDDLLNKLTGLKAASFATGSTRTGIEKPALVISASFDSGKFERVRFGAVGEDSFARRDGEESIAKLDGPAMADALKAFDAVTIPPSTDTKK
jgi:hypothetical protein